MTPILYDSDDIALLVATMSALAMFGAVLVVAWPFLARDRRAERLRMMRDERERIRSRERARLIAETSASLRQAREKMVTGLLARLRGGGSGEERAQFAETARLLRSAGFNRPNALALYVSSQVALPAIGLLGSAGYVFLLLDEPPGLATQLAILIGATGAGFFLPRVYVQNALNKRRTVILQSWPDALDLMLICVESGMTIETALARVADEIAGQCADLAEELNLLVAELSYLQDRAQAYRNLGERTGLHSVRSVVSSFIQSEKYGTSLANALRVISQEQRDQRMIAAEKKAASLPPKLTVPMILFFLPVLFVVIITPAAIQLMAMD